MDPRPGADRQLVQAGAVGGSFRPIRLQPAACRNRTLRGRVLNRTAARNSHGRIAGAVSSPLAESPSVPIRAAMTTRILVVRSCLGTLARQHRNHVCGRDDQFRFHRIVSRARMDAVARLRAKGVDALNGCGNHVSCHHYARLRPCRTAVATDPLSARMPQDIRPLDCQIPSRSWQIGPNFVAERIIPCTLGIPIFLVVGFFKCVTCGPLNARRGIALSIDNPDCVRSSSGGTLSTF